MYINIINYKLNYFHYINFHQRRRRRSNLAGNTQIKSSHSNPIKTRGKVHAEEAPQVHAEPTTGKLGPHGSNGFRGCQGEGLGLTGVDLSDGDEHETDLGVGVEELEGAVVVGEDR
jgi:hypothetical protein